MNKKEFLYTLDKCLGNMPASEKNDVLYDYEEHFQIGIMQGKTEEEICSTLGDPRILAKQYRVGRIINKAGENRSAGNIIRAILAAVSLGFFNILFMIPIFACLVAVLVSFYAAALGITVSGIGVFLAPLLQPIFPQFVSIPDINSGILVFFSFGLTSLGLLFCIGSIYLTKFFYNITLKYIKANIKIIGK